MKPFLSNFIAKLYRKNQFFSIHIYMNFKNWLEQNINEIKSLAGVDPERDLLFNNIFKDKLRLLIPLDSNEELQELTKLLAEDLAKKITSELSFQPNIRNIFKMFTAHIEVFLELIFNC